MVKYTGCLLPVMMRNLPHHLALCGAILILCLLPALTAGAGLPPPARPSCKDGSFWDDNMDRCESCHSYCRYHAATGVTTQCQDLCPTYMKRRQCDELFFYDDGLDLCAPCRDFCEAHRITGLTQECQNKCPEFMKLRANDAIKVDGDETRSQPLPGKSQSQSQSQSQSLSAASWSSGHIIAVALPTLAVALAVVVLAMYKRGSLCFNAQTRNRNGWYRRPQEVEEQDPRFPTAVVVDNSPGSKDRLAPGGRGSLENLSCTRV